VSCRMPVIRIQRCCSERHEPLNLPFLVSLSLTAHSANGLWGSAIDRPASGAFDSETHRRVLGRDLLDSNHRELLRPQIAHIHQSICY